MMSNILANNRQIFMKHSADKKLILQYISEEWFDGPQMWWLTFFCPGKALAWGQILDITISHVPMILYLMMCDTLP